MGDLNPRNGNTVFLERNDFAWLGAAFFAAVSAPLTANNHPSSNHPTVILSVQLISLLLNLSYTRWQNPFRFFFTSVCLFVAKFFGIR